MLGDGGRAQLEPAARSEELSADLSASTFVKRDDAGAAETEIVL